MAEATSDTVRSRLPTFSNVWSVRIQQQKAQTWYDAQNREKPLCAPRGRQPARQFLIVDPRKPPVYAARTICAYWLADAERQRSGTIIAFGADDALQVAGCCKCKQCPSGGKTIMLPYANRDPRDLNAPSLQCGRCEQWTGIYYGLGSWK